MANDLFYLIGYLRVHGFALFLLYSNILTPWLQFILNISCKRKHGQRIYNNWYSSSLNFKVEQHLSVVHSPRMYFPLITNLSPVIFCASLRLAVHFVPKLLLPITFLQKMIIITTVCFSMQLLKSCFHQVMKHFNSC